MRRLFAAVVYGVFGTNAYAQTPLLIDPAKVPVRLTGEWQSATGGSRTGEVNLYIDKINPDGTFTGKLDFLGGRNCKALGEPIKEGRITAEEVRLVVPGGAPNLCGDMTLVFTRGTTKFLEGKSTAQAGGGGGTPVWLAAPK